MKFAADFRRIAREALRGRWAIAVIAGLLASLLAAISSGGPEFTIELNEGHYRAGISAAGHDFFLTDNLSNGYASLWNGFGGMTAAALLAAVVSGILLFLLGGVIEIGYCKFNLELADRRENAEIGAMFRYFEYWKTAAAARLLQTVYIVLWSLLLIIPGIMASYSYAMTGYILAEKPHLSAGEAIAFSKQMMYGNRWRLFCLQFSFIGWSLLSMLCFGIGDLWLIPYRQAATAAFYREVSGTGIPESYEEQVG